MKINIDRARKECTHGYRLDPCSTCSRQEDHRFLQYDVSASIPFQSQLDSGSQCEVHNNLCVLHQTCIKYEPYRDTLFRVASSVDWMWVCVPWNVCHSLPMWLSLTVRHSQHRMGLSSPCQVSIMGRSAIELPRFCDLVPDQFFEFL